MRLKKACFVTKFLIVVVSICAIITLVSLQDQVRAAKAEVADLEQQVLYAEQEKALMEESLQDLGSDKSIKKIARTRLGMVESGEIVFYDADAQ